MIDIIYKYISLTLYITHICIYVHTMYTFYIYIHFSTASACQVATVKLFSTEDKTKVRTPMITNNSFCVLAWITFTTASKGHSTIKITDSTASWHLQHPSNPSPLGLRNDVKASQIAEAPTKKAISKRQSFTLHFHACCTCSPQRCPLSQLIPLITKHDPSASCPLLATPLQAAKALLLKRRHLCEHP